MGDEKRRRMRRPFLATCRNPGFKSRKKAFGKMLLMTRTLSLTPTLIGHGYVLWRCLRHLNLSNKLLLLVPSMQHCLQLTLYLCIQLQELLLLNLLTQVRNLLNR